MTRINIGIPPKRLSDKHLLAEHREIKRIPNMINNGKANVTNLPNIFTMGKGHVKFFYNKLGYLYNRYCLIYEECVNRGFNMTFYGNAWDNTPKELNNNWKPKPSDIKLIIYRIYDRGGFKSK